MQQNLFDTQITKGARFSADRRYRYTLWRIWDDRPLCNFLMLNPSTADENLNDPTVERCERRAREWGYGGLVVTNIFAYRSTDPRELLKVEKPEGGLVNDGVILGCARRSGILVCAWGDHGRIRNRGIWVKTLLANNRITAHCLRLTKSRQPSHPLYVPYSVKPIPMELP